LPLDLCFGCFTFGDGALGIDSPFGVQTKKSFDSFLAKTSVRVSDEGWLARKVSDRV